MLVLMPPTPPTTDFRAAPLTMSIAVLPRAPVAFPQQQSSSSSPSAALSYPSIPASGPPRRPKLTLNTAQVPATPFGKSTTALRIETSSVASPTSRNTFQNAYGSIDAQAQHAQSSTSSRVHPPTPLRTSSTDSITSATSSSSATSSEAYASSASSTDSILPPVPYRLPFNCKSILTNGPLPRPQRRRSFTTTRVMFPSPKKVAFRTPLTEDIHTEKYTVAHIETESSSIRSKLDLPSPQLVMREAVSRPSLMKLKPVQIEKQWESNGADANSEARSPHVGEKRESSDEEDDSDTCPSTPITRRSKKRREWVWTLGPIKSSPGETSLPTHEDETNTSNYENTAIQ